MPILERDGGAFPFFRGAAASREKVDFALGSRFADDKRSSFEAIEEEDICYRLGRDILPVVTREHLYFRARRRK